MLKKMLIVAAVLAIATPAFAYRGASSSWSQIDQGKIEVTKDDQGNIIGFADGYTPPNDRAVDWESGDDARQRKAEVWNWPATYDYVPVCMIPVRMEIGFWIQLQGCKTDRYLDLKQVKINLYRGWIDCTASANVATEWDAEWKSNGVIKTVEKEFDNVAYNSTDHTKNPMSTDNGKTAKFATKYKDQKIWIGLGLKNLDLYNTDLSPSNKCVEIGHMIVKVRPTVRPNEFMSSCTGSGQGYLSPTYQYYAPPTGL